jgi:drug/metabolite transporter (DMT)-like permease
MQSDVLDPPTLRAQPMDSSRAAATASIVSHHDTRRAALALLLACLFWGGSFTWAKNAIAAVNVHAGVDEHSGLGPLLLIAWRFFIAGVVWLAVFSKARRGWSWPSVGRAILLGVIFAAGMMAQQSGLTYTSEAVSAFLTSLSILFVPLLLTVVIRRPPAATLWLGIALATLGIWLMTGAARPSSPQATSSGFGRGELLGLASSLIFSIFLFVMNNAVNRDDPWRMAGGQFLAIGVMCGVASLILYPIVRTPAVLIAPLRTDVLMNLAMLIAFATLGGFGLMTFFQPKLDPSRTAMICLTEPIFAASYAFLFAGRSMSANQIIGGALILIANALAEWLESRKQSKLVGDAMAAGVAR